MTIHKHNRLGAWLARRSCYTGDPVLSSKTGLPAQGQWSHLSQWRYGGSVYECVMPPEASIVNDTNNDAEYHFGLWQPDKVDTTERQLGIVLTYWPIDSRTMTPTVKWYDPWNSGSPSTIYTIEGESSVAWTYGTYLDPANCHLFYTNVTYDPNSAAWQHMMIECLDMVVASISVFPIASASISGTQLQVTPSNVAEGRVIRGYDGTNTASLGKLIHDIGLASDDTNHESIEATTRPVLFQTGHGVCIYDVWSGTAWRNPFGTTTFKVRPRLLNGTGNKEAYPYVIVGGINDAMKIRFTSTTTSDTWTYTQTGNIAWDAPTAIPYTAGTGASLGAGRGLYIDGDADDIITVEVYGVNLDEVMIRSVGLFESPPW